MLTTEWCHHDDDTAVEVWRIMSHDGALPLVVRPSAVGRDRTRPAAVGAVEASVVVRDLDGFLTAVDAVRHGRDRTDLNVPVLVQSHVAGPWRGVLFGAEGRPSRRRRTVVVARDRDTTDTEWTAELDDAGRVRDVLSGPHLDHPPVEVLARLAGLAAQVADVFDGPHDIEWAADERGRVHLLRLRPVVCLHVSAEAGGRCDRRPLALVPALVGDGRVDETAA